MHLLVRPCGQGGPYPMVVKDRLDKSSEEDGNEIGNFRM